MIQITWEDRMDELKHYSRERRGGKNRANRAFIYAYYAVSPTMVKWFGEYDWFKNMWREKLDRMVSRLQAEGVEATPYEDRTW